MDFRLLYSNLTVICEVIIQQTRRGGLQPNKQVSRCFLEEIEVKAVPGKAPRPL